MPGVRHGRRPGCGAAVEAGRLSGRNDRAEDDAFPPDQHPRPFHFRPLQRQIREIAWNRAGIIRDKAGLETGLEELMALENRLHAARPENALEKRRKQDLKSAAFVLKAILTASLARKESRGAFIRREFPLGERSGWRKNSCLDYDPHTQEFSVSHHAVSESTTVR